MWCAAGKQSGITRIIKLGLNSLTAFAHHSILPGDGRWCALAFCTVEAAVRESRPSLGQACFGSACDLHHWHHFCRDADVGLVTERLGFLGVMPHPNGQHIGTTNNATESLLLGAVNCPQQFKTFTIQHADCETDDRCIATPSRLPATSRHLNHCTIIEHACAQVLRLRPRTSQAVACQPLFGLWNSEHGLD